MMQKSKSRNVLASHLGEEGHEVAKGVQANWIHRGAPRPANPVRRHPAKSVWMVVRMIMILDVDVTAERRHYNTHCPTGNPQPSGPKAPSNLRTLRPSGRSILRTLTPQARYTRRNVLLLPIYSGWCFLWQQRWLLHFLIIRIRWSIFPLPACGRSTLRTMMSRIRS